MSTILNSLGCCAALFLLVFAWFYFCLKDAATSALLALAVTACAFCLFYKALCNLQSATKQKKAKKKEILQLLEHLRYHPDNGKIFAPLMKYFCFEIEQIKPDSLVATKMDTRCYVALLFGEDKLRPKDLRRQIVAAKRQSCQKLYIFCAKAEGQIVSLANAHIPTTVVDVANLRLLFAESNTMPRFAPTKSAKTRVTLGYVFSKKQSKLYFASSIFMLLTAAVAYFPWYLLAWATVAFGLGAYSLFNKKFNCRPTCVTLN